MPVSGMKLFVRLVVHTYQLWFVLMYITTVYFNFFNFYITLLDRPSAPSPTLHFLSTKKHNNVPSVPDSPEMSALIVDIIDIKDFSTNNPPTSFKIHFDLYADGSNDPISSFKTEW